MKYSVLLFMFFSILFTLSSCGAVETIFKAGMWWAFFLIGIAVVLVLVLISKAKK